MEKWSEEKARSWYESRPWIRGVAYYPSCCVNRVELWQEYNSQEVKACLDNEMKVAKEWGFNALRMISMLEVYIDQHDSFMANLEDYLSICAKHGIGVMFCFGNDCVVQKQNYEWPVYGPQPCEIGYHSGVKKSPHVSMPGPGYNIIDEPEYEAKFYEMIREIVTKYKDDERIVVWDIYNEPGNSRRLSMSMKYMENAFRIARECNPTQPCTAGCWSYDEANRPFKEIELRALELSDIITFHCYLKYDDFTQVVEHLKKYNRPIVVTEWLHRIFHNDVFDLFPYMRKEKIGCYCWGWFTGKSQTREPWLWMWDVYDTGKGRDWDWTKWQHDLTYINGRPYDPKEYDVIVHECHIADEEFSKR